ncbi:sugar ABC transporter permease YjfF [Actinosynnema pretiosum subsp. pretiosum]|uniref:Monosaccharide-transporting ATPase n=2 Tax=Actinosynnema TaxID=40566 RepID=C6WE57_ACTMD|nr:galactofuranose ABC transporter, permease protein YjfF [Actinosynnema mirum]ACU35800.1 Monosaccharide-transporting ATPase [Actinosynnema mirum DSM 43827]AXX29225.1 Putative sugar ABC transport system, permease protein YjfF [Actinosynnema pretiosum subsp. pretiosum]QUF06509.1 sugar ABC transporter permease YjfF [Actinosynnema pretiosum subsp. pretiosum]
MTTVLEPQLPVKAGPGAPSRFLPVIATFVVFVLTFGAGSVAYEGFASGQVVANLFIDNAFLIVLAVGMTFVILTGGIDLSVGSVIALSTMIAAAALRAGWPPVVVVVAVLATGSLLGFLMGMVIHKFGVQPFIVTLAGMFLARGLCFVISVESISIKDKAFRSLATATIELPGGVTITPPVVIALVVVAVAAYVLHLTRFGRTVYAVGGSEASARLMGLRTGQVKVGVYVISGFCSSLAGLLFALYMLSGYSLHGVGMELDAIAAVVVGGSLLSGGVGFVVGSVAGVLVLGTVQTVISFQGTLSSWWTKIVIGGLLLAFIVLQRLIVRRGGS